jgi:DNA mismatch repair protein MutS
MKNSDTSGTTPLRHQYLTIKAQYPDCILLFRLGDFYETFDADAEITARELDLVLTSRGSSQGDRWPMAGVPYHAVETYIARLIERGYHVAVCEQLTEPTGRGLVEREVTRVITPGTVIEPTLLNEQRANYLLAILPVGDLVAGHWDTAGLAYADISTGEFALTQLNGDNAATLVVEELARLAPREVIMPQSWVDRGATFAPGIHLVPYDDWHFDRSSAEESLLSHFRVRTLEGFGVAEYPAGVRAAGAVLQYVRGTQRGSLGQLLTLRPYSTSQFMVLDPFTRRNLELTETIRSRDQHGSLLGILDRTRTAMGARLLRTWIAQPLLDLARLNARLDAIDSLRTDELLRAGLRDMLSATSDLERLTNRLLVGKATPRDLFALRQTLEVIPSLRQKLESVAPMAVLHQRLNPCDDIRELVTRAIVDEPPANFSKVGVIRPEYSSELTEVLETTREAREWITNLEPVERERTGIASLKVGYNKVFGYYIEVSHANSTRVPSDYIRKQTLVNAERYITPELKDYEALVLNAEEQILSLERALFDDLCQTIARSSQALLDTARALAHVDAFCSLADVAAREGFCRPTLTEDDRLIIRSGRHPVVEAALDGTLRFVPNDTQFDTMSRVHIITGPNMAGKSTYIRQVALITLMAQIGSFVPADEATIGLVDRIFARIGAQDEIHAGFSTFMVEMTETARLLSGSTRRSLLILDEVGRGTSTYDGLAIARSVVEYIHNSPRLNCRTLFATHYHELTELPNVLPRARNFNAAVSEDGDEIVFLHRILPGAANRSYGVHVAQLAGLPRPVVDRARELLHQLETQRAGFEPQRVQSSAGRRPVNQTTFIAEEVPAQPVVEALRALEVDALSPIEALTKLYELKRLASG